MAEFKLISEADAPRPSRQTGRLAARMREYEKYIEGVKTGRVGMLTPSPGETARGIALRVGRAGRRINKQTSAWIVGETVYFKVI
ncbi:MAG: hypothetical protein ACR2HN_10745 [Tepidiformaceae bacterium]